MKRGSAPSSACTSEVFDAVGSARPQRDACPRNDEQRQRELKEQARTLLELAANSDNASAQLFAEASQVQQPMSVRRSSVRRAQSIAQIALQNGHSEQCATLFPAQVRDQSWYRTALDYVRRAFRARGAEEVPADVEAALLASSAHLNDAQRLLTAVGLVNWYTSCESLEDLYVRTRTELDTTSYDAAADLLAVAHWQDAGFIVDATFPYGTLRRAEPCDRDCNTSTAADGSPCCWCMNDVPPSVPKPSPPTAQQSAALADTIRTYDANASKFQTSPLSIRAEVYNELGQAKTIQELVEAASERCTENSCRCTGFDTTAVSRAAQAAALGFATTLAWTSSIEQAACVGAASGAAAGAGSAMFSTRHRCDTCNGARQVLCFPQIQPPLQFATRISVQALVDMFEQVQRQTQRIEATRNSLLQYGFAGLDFHLSYVLATTEFVSSLCALSGALASAPFLADLSVLNATVVSSLLHLYHTLRLNHFRAMHVGNQLLYADTAGLTEQVRSSAVVQALGRVADGMYAGLRGSMRSVWNQFNSVGKLARVAAFLGTLVYGYASGALSSIATWMGSQGLMVSAGHLSSIGLMVYALLATSTDVLQRIWDQLTWANLAFFARYGLHLPVPTLAFSSTRVPTKSLLALLGDQQQSKTVQALLTTYSTSPGTLYDYQRLLEDVYLTTDIAVLDEWLKETNMQIQTQAVFYNFVQETSAWLESTCASLVTVRNVALLTTFAMLSMYALDASLVYASRPSACRVPMAQARVPRILLNHGDEDEALAARARRQSLAGAASATLARPRTPLRPS